MQYNTNWKIVATSCFNCLSTIGLSTIQDTYLIPFGSQYQKSLKIKSTSMTYVYSTYVISSPANNLLVCRFFWNLSGKFQSNPQIELEVTNDINGNSQYITLYNGNDLTLNKIIWMIISC